MEFEGLIESRYLLDALITEEKAYRKRVSDCKQELLEQQQRLLHASSRTIIEDTRESTGTAEVHPLARDEDGATDSVENREAADLLPNTTQLPPEGEPKTLPTEMETILAKLGPLSLAYVLTR